MQIRFGTYHYGNHLPTLEEASQLFLVSIDTVRAAYLSLKQEGYISLSRSVGAVVKVYIHARRRNSIYRTFTLLGRRV